MTDTSRPAGAPPQGASRIHRNVLANWGTYFISVGISFFLSPFVVHHLGNTLYGIWTLIASLTGYLGLLDMGVRGAVTRYVARYHAQGEHGDASRTASSALAFFSVAGFVAILVSFLLAAFGIQYFKIPPELVGPAQIVICIAGLTVATSMVSGVFGGVVAGLQRLEVLNGIESSVMILRAGVIVVALRSGYGIITLGFIQLAFTIIAGTVTVVMAFRNYPELRIGVAWVARTHVRAVFSFGVYSFFLHIFSYLILYTDAVVIAATLPVVMVTFFSIASNLATYARQLVGAMTTAFTPMASALEARGENAAVVHETLSWTRYSTSLILAIGITFITRGSTFIGLWMGPSYAGPSGHVLAVLSIGTMVGMASCVPWALSFGLGKHQPLVPVYLVEALANLGLSIFLAKRIGIVGVAWGTTIPEIVFSATFWPWYMSKVLRIPVFHFIRNGWLRPIAAMVPFAAVTYVIERTWTANNLFIFFLQVATALPVAIVAFWFLCVSKGDRAALAARLRSSLGRAEG
jgi:O-antigen/teichoic acid export membrane protein